MSSFFRKFISKPLPLLPGQKPSESKPAHGRDLDSTAAEVMKKYNESTIYGGYLCFSYFIAPSLVRPLRNPGDGPLVSKYLWDRLSPSVQLDFIQRSQTRDHIYLPPPAMSMSGILVDLAYDYAERMSRDHQYQEKIAPGVNLGLRPLHGRPVIPRSVCAGDGWLDEETEAVPTLSSAPKNNPGPLDAAEPKVLQEPLLPMLEGLEGIKSFPIPSFEYRGVLFCPSSSPVPADTYKEWEHVPIEHLRGPWPAPDYLGLTGPDPQASEKRLTTALANMQDKLDGFVDLNLVDSTPFECNGSIFSSPSHYSEMEDDEDRVYQGGIPLTRMRPAIESSAWKQRVDLRCFDVESPPGSSGSVDSDGSLSPELDIESPLELESGLTSSPGHEQFVCIARGRERTTSRNFVYVSPGSALLDASLPDLGSLSSMWPSREGSITYSPSWSDDEEGLCWEGAEMGSRPARSESA